MKNKTQFFQFSQMIDVYLNLISETSIEMGSYFNSLNLPKDSTVSLNYLSQYWTENSIKIKNNERKAINFIFLYSKMFDKYKAEWVKLKKEVLSLYELMNKTLKDLSNQLILSKFKELGNFLIEEIGNYTLNLYNSNENNNQSYTTSATVTSTSLNNESSPTNSENFMRNRKNVLIGRKALKKGSIFQFCFKDKVNVEDQKCIESTTNEEFKKNINDKKKIFETLIDIAFLVSYINLYM